MILRQPHSARGGTGAKPPSFFGSNASRPLCFSIPSCTPCRRMRGRQHFCCFCKRIPDPSLFHIERRLSRLLLHSIQQCRLIEAASVNLWVLPAPLTRSFASSVNTSTAVWGIQSLAGFRACLSPVTSSGSAFCSPDFLSPHR